VGQVVNLRADRQSAQTARAINLTRKTHPAPQPNRSTAALSGVGAIIRTMAVSADTLRLHLDYTAWASRRLLDCAAKLSAEELTRDFKTSDRTVLDTLAHVFAADRTWFGRIQGDPPASFINSEDRQLSVLEKEPRH